MAELTTIADRVKTSVGGLLFTAFSLVFVVAGIAMVVTSARQAATYLPALATVDQVTGTEEASDKVSIAYSFSRNGKRYTGSESADDEEKLRFNELRQYKVGQQLTVYYDPCDPAQLQRTVKAEAFGLVFTIFALPFLALALNQLWLGLTGKEMVRSRQPNAQSSAVPGGGMFWIFVLTCLAGAVGQLALSATLPWPWSLAGGLTILFVAIPVVNIGANRLVKRRRSAKGVKLQNAHAADARDDSDTDAQEDSDAESSITTTGGLGKKLAIALAVTIFWCGITGLFGYLAIGSLIKHHYASLRFARAEGVVLSSKIKISRGSKGGSSFAPKIKYRYTVAGQDYIGERYDFVSMSSNDDSYAQKAVSENPPGKAVTVYYDPGDPSEAILHLEAPASSYFLLLFLQPFFLIGLAMIGWCATLPRAHNRLQRFLQCDAAPPWKIPGWGVMEQDFDGLVLRSRRNPFAPLGHFLVGYGLTCFFSIFVVGFLFHGFGDANLTAIRWAFLVAGGVGTAALLRKLLEGRAAQAAL